MSDRTAGLRRAVGALFAAGGLNLGLVGVHRTATAAFAWSAAEVGRAAAYAIAIFAADRLRARGVSTAQLWAFGFVTAATFLPSSALAGGGVTAGSLYPTLRTAAFTVASLATGYTYLAVGGVRGLVWSVAGANDSVDERDGRTER